MSPALMWKTAVAPFASCRACKQRSQIAQVGQIVTQREVERGVGTHTHTRTHARARTHTHTHTHTHSLTHKRPWLCRNTDRSVQPNGGIRGLPCSASPFKAPWCACAVLYQDWRFDLTHCMLIALHSFLFLLYCCPSSFCSQRLNSLC